MAIIRNKFSNSDPVYGQVDQDSSFVDCSLIKQLAISVDWVLYVLWVSLSLLRGSVLGYADSF